MPFTRRNLRLSACRCFHQRAGFFIIMDLAEINAVHKLLTECMRRAQAGFKVDYTSLCEELNLSGHVFLIAVSKGMFKDKGNGKYECTIEKIQPIMCRDILSQYHYMNENGVLVEIKQNNITPGICAECGTAFKKRTGWHIYCSESCKIAAWEKRTGKKFVLASKKN